MDNQATKNDSKALYNHSINSPDNWRADYFSDIVVRSNYTRSSQVKMQNTKAVVGVKD
tara:strand:- start:445 stop:618 length:174 start_codon:yes stop_codon:yes gene_type:complete